MRLRACTPTIECCTRREIGLVVMEGEASRCTMEEAVDMIKEGGTEVMPTATPDPPETGGLEAMRTETGRPSQSAGIVARKATEKASVGKSVPIRREPDAETVPDMPTRETGSVCTTPKTQGELEKGLSS